MRYASHYWEFGYKRLNNQPQATKKEPYLQFWYRTQEIIAVRSTYRNLSTGNHHHIALQMNAVHVVYVNHKTSMNSNEQTGVKTLHNLRQGHFDVNCTFSQSKRTVLFINFDKLYSSHVNTFQLTSNLYKKHIPNGISSYTGGIFAESDMA
jgi:elongation factor P--beta-lysine ligase